MLNRTVWFNRLFAKECAVLIITMLVWLMLPVASWAEALPGPLLQSDWLEKNLAKVVILDVRMDVDSFNKRSKGRSPVNPCGAGIKGKGPTVVAGHIPEAVLVRWSLVTTQKKVYEQKMDGWLPEKEDFQRLMQRSGVNANSLVVITSKGEKIQHMAMAARLYLTMKYFGHEHVALLDGGTAAWLQSGRKVTFGRSRTKPGNFKAGSAKTAWIATLPDVEVVSQSQESGEQLLDNRESAAYLGIAQHMEKVADKWKGHIPGAKNFPVSYMANSMGSAANMFASKTLRQVAELTGIDPAKPTLLYCNSGVMASLGWFMFHELFGNAKVRLFDGSIQEWVAAKKPVTVMKME